MLDPDQVVLTFFIFWAVLGIGGGSFFFFSKNVELKRKLHPVFVFSAGILFILFAYLLRLPVIAFVITIPAVIFITMVNLKVTKFCDECGKTNVSHNPFSIPKFCSKCGAALAS